VTISRPAIEPAISTLPVKNQLIAKVSSVPNVRQLMALRIDLVCVSAPRNKITRRASLLDDHRTYHAARIVRCHAYIGVLHRKISLGKIIHGHDARLRAFWLQKLGKLLDLTKQSRPVRKRRAFCG
jgi:hypothetical protein